MARATKKTLDLKTSFGKDEPGNPNWKIHHQCCTPLRRVWRPAHFPCLPVTHNV